MSKQDLHLWILGEEHQNVVPALKCEPACFRNSNASHFGNNESFCEILERRPEQHTDHKHRQMPMKSDVISAQLTTGERSCARHGVLACQSWLVCFACFSHKKDLSKAQVCGLFGEVSVICWTRQLSHPTKSNYSVIVDPKIFDDLFVERLRNNGRYSTPHHRGPELRRRRFRAYFGIEHEAVSLLWNTLCDASTDNLRGWKPEYLLNALFFLKIYASEEVNAGFAGQDEKTVRKWNWKILEAIADLDCVRMSVNCHTATAA